MFFVYKLYTCNLTFLGSFLGFQQKGVTMSIVLYSANGNIQWWLIQFIIALHKEICVIQYSLPFACFSFHRLLGDYYRKQGIIYRAIEEYQLALQFNPKNQGIKQQINRLQASEEGQK